MLRALVVMLLVLYSIDGSFLRGDDHEKEQEYT